MLDVAIIGGGIVGCAVAYELTKYQVKAALFEKENDLAIGATKANSAIIHAGYDPKPGSLLAKLNVQGNQMAKELAKKLAVPFRECGSLVLAFSEEDKQTIKHLYQQGVANGVPNLQILTGEETKQLEPNLSNQVIGALYAPTAGIINPWEYALALAEVAVLNDLSLHLDTEIQDVSKQSNGFVLKTNRGEFKTNYVINAAGLYADKLHNMVAKPSFRILPNRGEYYLLDKSEGDIVSHIIFQCPTEAGKGTLVAPTVGGNLIVGPNNEPLTRRDDLATTHEGLLQVAKMARKSVPKLCLNASIRNFSGIRAASDSDDFIIAQADDAPGWIDLAGIKSPGLSAAPAIAPDAIALLEKSGLKLEKKKTIIDSRTKVRFRKLTQEQQEEKIKENPAYGQIVCRCETITEGEILDALQSPIPPKTLDGVKRRCNTGMGRCQGGFCSPRVMEILSKAWGVSQEEILMDANGTYILAGETKGGKENV